MRNVTILFAVMAVLALAGTAWGADKTWDVTSGNWDVDSHWIGGEPGSSDYAYITNDGTAIINNYSADTAGVYVGLDGVANSGLIQIMGGTSAVLDAESFNIRDGGKVELTTGKLDTSATYAGVNIGGLFEMTGGEWYYQFCNNTPVGSQHFNIVTSTGTFSISGGTVYCHDWADGGFSVEGTIEVIGTGADITFHQEGSALDIAYKQSGLMRCEIGNSGIAVIKVDNQKDGDSILAVFESGAKLDVDLGTGVTVNQNDYFLLLDVIDGNAASEIQGSANLSLVAEDVGVWEIVWTDVDSDGDIDEMGAKYIVPEPATLALLGLGGIGVLLRRRRK